MMNGMLDILRSQTPGWNEGVHLNPAGASLMPASALHAIQQHLALESELGPMEAAVRVRDRLGVVRQRAAQLLNAQVDEIALMTSGSAAFGAFFSSLPPLRTGDRILVGRQEWGGNLASYQRAAARAGAVVETMPCHDDGRVNVEALPAIIDDRVRLISLTWLPANGGLINDAAGVGRVARKAGIPYFIDAAQALGQIPIDVCDLGCDVLKGAGRKHLRGPRGTGLLYVRREFAEHLDPPWVDVFSAPLGETNFTVRAGAGRFETSEASVALQLGLGESLSLALSVGVDANVMVAPKLAQQLRNLLAHDSNVHVLDPMSGSLSGIVSFSVKGIAPLALQHTLARERVFISSNGIPYTPLDMRARGIDAIARASFSYLNTENDVTTLAHAVSSARSKQSY